MTKSHWCDRLRPICSDGGGRGRLRACGMRGMNRCDMAVVCTDVCNAWNVCAKCGMCRCRQMWFWNVGNVGVAQPTAALQRGSHHITTVVSINAVAGQCLVRGSVLSYMTWLT